MRFPSTTLLEKFAVATVLATAVATTSYAGADLELGKAVDFFQITTLDGTKITPVRQQGRVLVVNLWATWCAPCREEMPAIDAFYKKYRHRDVDVVAISVDDRGELESVIKVMASYSFQAALALDSDLGSLGRIRHVPATFVIDRGGILRRNGWKEAGVVDLMTLEKTVRPLLRQALD